MKKRILAVILTLSMLMGMFAMLPVGAASADAGTLTTVSNGWNGTEALEPGADEEQTEAGYAPGTKENPYLISKAQHLLWLSQNAGTAGSESFDCVGQDYTTKEVYPGMEDYVYCKQTANIDLNGHDMLAIGAYANLNNSANLYLTKAQYFHGSYDGQGYTISNGRFVSAGSDDNINRPCGMFGVLWGSTVQNIVFDNIVSAGTNVTGIVAGVAYSDCSGSYTFTDDRTNYIRHITVKDNCVIQRKDALTTTIGKSAWGGIAGYALNTVVENCTSAAQMKLTSNIQWVGGIVGVMAHDTTVTHCMHTGTISFPSTFALGQETHIGGIVGSWRSFNTVAVQEEVNAIDKCINEGTFSGTLSASTLCLGGILGATFNLLNETSSVVITNTFSGNRNLSDETVWSHANVTSAKRVGGMAGCFYIADNTYAAVELTDCYTVAYTPVSHNATSCPSSETVGAVYLYSAYETDCGVKTADEMRDSALYMDLRKVDTTAGTELGWNGSTTMAPMGTGTKEDPYLISSPENLRWMRTFINSGAQYFSTFGFNHKEWVPTYTSVDNEEEDLSIECAKTVDYTTFANAPQVYFKQTCDIDLNGYSLTSITSYIVAEGAKNGTNIAKGQWFGGYYDGQGYAIKNGSIKGSGTNDNWNGGLFGLLWGATIENIVFDNVHSTGCETVAMLAGKVLDARDFCALSEDFETYGHIFNARKTVIRNIEVRDTCTVTHEGRTSESGIYVGGIVASAQANTTIEKCINKADIVVDANVLAAGGIVGLMHSNVIVDHCINEGSIYYTGAWRTSYGGATTYNYLRQESAFGGIAGTWGGNDCYGTNALTNCINKGSFATEKVSNNYLMSYGGILGRTYTLADNGGSTYTFANNINMGASPADNINAYVQVEGKANRVAALIGSAWNDNAYDWVQLTVTNSYSVPFGGIGGYTLYPSASNPLVASTNKTMPSNSTSRVCAVVDGTCKTVASADEMMELALYHKINFEVNGFEHAFIGAQTKKEANGTYSIRLICGLNSLDYKALSYDVMLTLGDKQALKNYTADTVYTSFLDNGYGGATKKYASEYGFQYVSLFTFTGLAADTTYSIGYTPKVVYANGTQGEGKPVILTVCNSEIVYEDPNAPVSGEMKINGVDISKYSIVYEKDNIPAYYTATSLQKYIREATGKELPLIDSSASATYEIRVGYSELSKTVAKGGYAVVQQGTALELLFSGSLAATEMIDQVKELYLNNREYNVNLRTSGNALYVEENHKIKGDTTAPTTGAAIFEKRDTGDIRVMFHNIHGYTFLREAQDLGYTGDYTTLASKLISLYEQMLISYDPDIIGLQEVNDRIISVYNKLTASGYTGYRGNGTYGTGFPILWKTEKFDKVDAGTDYNTTAGSSYGSNWVVLKEKSTGKQFAVFSSHFTADSIAESTYASVTDPTLKAEKMHALATYWRNLLATQMVTQVNNVLTNHSNVNVVITGGDYNHRMEDPQTYNSKLYDPYATLTGTLTNVRDDIEAPYVAYYGMRSGHKYDANTGMYQFNSKGCKDATNSIDHALYVERNNTDPITLKRYQVATDRYSCTLSDHPLHFVDFAWN